MTAILVVEHLVVLELAFEVALVPKPDPIQILAPDGSDQPLDESMRTGRCENGLDLIDFEYPKVRSPAMKAKQRIMVRGKMPRQSLPRDREANDAEISFFRPRSAVSLSSLASEPSDTRSQ